MADHFYIISFQNSIKWNLTVISKSKYNFTYAHYENGTLNTIFTLLGLNLLTMLESECQINYECTS
jgi:hypothetical protein